MLKLSLESKNNTLYENIKYYFNEKIEITQYNNTHIFYNYDIFIFDSFDFKTINNLIEKIYLDNILFINISNDFEIKNILNYKKPLKLTNIFDKINYFIDYYKENIAKLKNGILNFNSKSYSSNNKTINFTEKENNFIKYIWSNKNCRKEDLIKNIWNNQQQDNKILDTILYGIKQKLKNEDLINFININNYYFNIEE